MKTLIPILFLLIGCNTTTRVPVTVYDTVYKDTVIYNKKYKDTTIYNVFMQDTVVFLPMYLPEYLRSAVQSGNVKFTIRYR